MSVRIRFFGVAAYELINGNGQHILIDPFLDESPASLIKSTDLERVDLILISHAAFDHMGDTEAIARRTRVPAVCGVRVDSMRVQLVECHRWSQI